MKKLMYLTLAILLLSLTSASAQTPVKKEVKKECCDHSKTITKDHKGCVSDKNAIDAKATKAPANINCKDKECSSDKNAKTNTKAKTKTTSKDNKGCCSEKKA